MDKYLQLKICTEQLNGQSIDGNIYLLHDDSNYGDFIDLI